MANFGKYTSLFLLLNAVLLAHCYPTDVTDVDEVTDAQIIEETVNEEVEIGEKIIPIDWKDEDGDIIPRVISFGSDKDNESEDDGIKKLVDASTEEINNDGQKSIADKIVGRLNERINHLQERINARKQRRTAIKREAQIQDLIVPPVENESTSPPIA